MLRRIAMAVCAALVCIGQAAGETAAVTLTSPEDRGDLGGYAGDLIAGNTHDVALEQMLRKHIAELVEKPIEHGVVKRHPAAEGLGLRVQDFPDVGQFVISELNRSHYGEDLFVTIKKHVSDIATRHKAESDAKAAAEKAAREARKKK